MGGLLRLCTAGSVDDGKSTLIGRLLYESRTLYEDQISAVEAASRSRSAGPIDFSLFTDGLRAEREQGITIDVAYRYFATPRRSFVLADTPGHEQYTRNMATGASTAELAVLLVDARNGLRPQSHRHARIARLLGITSFVLAVNKMDLVGFSQARFDEIRGSFQALLGGASIQAIPVSALHGDNLTGPSVLTPWYHGPALLEHLETVDVGTRAAAGPFRFPVQLVLRPDDRFRGYAGQIASGRIAAGDPVRIWPSGRTSRVKRIVTADGDLAVADAPLSVALVLEDELDVGRGDLLAWGDPCVSERFRADVVWLDERPLDASRVYVMKHATRTLAAEVEGEALALNGIGQVTVTAGRPLVFDRYADHRQTGCFILIDPATNATAGAGMIAEPVAEPSAAGGRLGAAARLACLARSAPTESDAVDAMRRALEEILT